MSYAQQERRKAREELAGVLLALADDTIRKLNQEEELDQGYILGDLLGRLVEIAAKCGESPALFETTLQYANRVYAYPIQEPETAVAPETQPRHTFIATLGSSGCGAMLKPANRVTGERPVYCTLPKADSVHKFEEFK